MICPRCNTEFASNPKKLTQVYCSDRCARKAYNRRRMRRTSEVRNAKYSAFLRRCAWNRKVKGYFKLKAVFSAKRNWDQKEQAWRYWTGKQADKLSRLMKPQTEWQQWIIQKSRQLRTRFAPAWSVQQRERQAKTWEAFCNYYAIGTLDYEKERLHRTPWTHWVILSAQQQKNRARWYENRSAIFWSGKDMRAR